MVQALETIGFLLLGALPAIIVTIFILRNFRDAAVSRKSLFIQFLLGAFPLSIAVVIVQGLLILLIMLAFYSDRLKYLNNGEQAVSPESPTTASTSHLVIHLFSIVRHHTESPQVALMTSFLKPLWKAILTFLLISYIAAATVEELGKWMLARRYRTINAKVAETDPTQRMGCKGILSIVTMGALGFAFTENILFDFAISQGHGNVFLRLGVVLLRAFVAFTLHVATQFYVGVAAARKLVFHDEISIPFSLFIGILFHGTFNSFDIISIPFATSSEIPTWVSYITIGLQLGSVCLLLLLCRGRYKALIERERMVNTNALMEDSFA